MTIKPEYQKYSSRVLTGMLRALFLSVFYIFILFFYDIEYFGRLIVSSVFFILLIILTINGIKKSRLYLNSITINESECILEIYEKDTFKEKIELKLSETRIKILEMFFGLKVGRNFKLVIESKQGISFRKVFQQYQTGGWDIDTFKEVVKLYGKMKGVVVPIASVTESGFSTDKS